MKVIEISKSGWLYIIITIFLGFSAINTGNNLIYLITSFLLGVMGISGFFGKRNISGVDLDFYIQSDLFAETEGAAVVRLINRKRFFPCFLVKVSTPFFSVIFPFVKPERESLKYVKVRFPKRGINSIQLFTVSSKFPFGFFERFSYFEGDVKVLVFPKPVECEPYRVFCDESEGEIPEKGDEELSTVRDYIPGDVKKMIHWKATAKTDSLKVKEMTQKMKKTLIVDFDKVKIEDFELKISCITYMCLKYPMILKMGKRLIKDRKEILTTLALL